MFEKEIKPCIALRDAKMKGQGITFLPDHLSYLVNFSQKYHQTLDRENRTDFDLILKRAIKAKEAKEIFALTAEEVTTWFQFFARVQDTRVTAISNWVRDYQREIHIGGIKDTFMPLVIKLAESTSKGVGAQLNELERSYLHQFCHWLIKEGQLPPMDKVGDPLHPWVTAAKKLCCLDDNELSMFFDADEVFYLERIMQQFKGFSRPGTGTSTLR